MKTFKESWALHKALANVPMDDCANVPIPESDPEPIKAGQVRLMAGMVGWNWVLIVREWDPDHSWVIMPFSFLDVPGEDEFKPRYDGGFGRRVLQAWNVRTLAKQTLESCPVWDTVEDQDTQDAWNAYRAYLKGTVAEGMEDRMGTADEETMADYCDSVLGSWKEVDYKDMLIQLGEA